MNIKVMVAAHKKYQMPEDPTYLPIFVGAALHDNIPSNYQGDNSGDNISLKNPNYNELTAVYWGWKNLKGDVTGLVHYRRYFREPGKRGDKFSRVLTKQSIESALRDHDVILPTKRRYYIETIESHYRHSHQPQGIDALKDVFTELSPTYENALNQTLNSTSAHMFNMFIMKQSDFHEFAKWMFSVLDKVENRIDFDTLVGNEKRVMGFISELLIDVWIRANRKSYIEFPVMYMEKEHLFRKGLIFLRNKISGSSKIINTHIK
ncbi:DUF4422 domain-containing protein [Lacticaseibacillus paracasei]|uniref:DUF4422 domain-containing protein n=1 Tax=Lacticaseibacillus paracasei TaxID=1597 RepID=UPI00273A0CAA|nr:DUF4422 domain-containing protein [Lacticaseibacillus paracasei]MDP4467177.1 DUF4422 domain-containing protein [Lacticaseibacillus paracasei]